MDSLPRPEGIAEELNLLLTEEAKLDHLDLGFLRLKADSDTQENVISEEKDDTDIGEKLQALMEPTANTKGQIT